jgi:metal-responsive CopG/Arc/MetJ family transcriptional regulator
MGVAKILITLEDDLLERVDARVQADGTTRSRFLAELARAEVATLGPAERLRRAGVITRARTVLADVEPDGINTTEWIRAQRDSGGGIDERLDRH